MTKSGIEQNSQELALQAESLSELLRNKRLEMGIELSEVAARLKIKVQDLEAIESNALHLIPRHLYVIGVIRSYSVIVDIDQTIIEEKIKLLSVESNVNNKKYNLINIGENLDLKPNREQFFNFLIIATLLFVIMLIFYHFYEDTSKFISTHTLVQELEQIDSDK